MDGDDRFFALSLDVLCVIDLAGRYLRVNPAFERALGYSAQELCGRPLLDFVHPDDRPATQQDLERLARGRDSTEFENRFLARDGGERWFSWNCSAPEPGTRLAHAVARDVTERKRFEQALQMQAKVLDSMAEGVVLTDQAGTICYTNPAQDEMFGFAPGELMDQHVGVLLDEPAEAAGRRVADIAERALARGAWSGELASRRRDGAAFTVMARVNPLRMQARDYTVWVHEDVTERRRAELVRQRLEQMKREFVATVSHELRTPLTSIRGSLGLLAAGVLGDLPADAGEAVSIAERNCQRLVGLVNDLLDLQRAEAGRIEVEFAPLDVGSLLSASLDAVRGMAEAAGVEIEVQCHAGPVVADRGRLVQVIVNLLGNAVKFSNRGSVVRLVAAEVGSFLDVRVHDHGRGVPPDQLQVIFEPFRQVEASDARDKGGTGLGLAICKAIVERHDGGIGATSELGKGSTFWFRVPLSGPAPARAAGG